MNYYFFKSVVAGAKMLLKLGIEETLVLEFVQRSGIKVNQIGMGR